MTRLVQLADLHFGVEHHEALTAAARWIAGGGVDGVVVCGDLSQRGKRSEFEAAAQWLSQFTAPILVTPGNHDTPLLDMSARALAPFKRFWGYFGERARPLELARAHVAGINTSRGWQARRNWAEGAVDLDELSLAVEGPDGCDARVGVIACHHPFLSPREAPLRISTRRGRRASDLMAASHAQVLLTGHVHTPSVERWETERGRYLNLTCGTLSQRLRKTLPSFNVIDITEDRIEACGLEYTGSGLSERRLGAWSRDKLEPLSPSIVDP